MKKIKYYLLVLPLVAAVALSSCAKEPASVLNPEHEKYRKALLQETECGFYVAGEADVKFDGELHQLYYSVDEVCFRMLDNDAVEYMEVTMSDTPEMGAENLAGTITVEGLSERVSSGSKSFFVLKKDGDKCWLWCDTDVLGVVMLCLE